MPTLKLKLTKEFEVDLTDENVRDSLIEILTTNGAAGPASESELHDAVREQLGDDMALLVDLDSITDLDFEISIPPDHGISAPDPDEDGVEEDAEDGTEEEVEEDPDEKRDRILEEQRQRERNK